MTETEDSIESEGQKEGSSRDLWVVLGPSIAVTVVGFLLALSFVGAPPPKTLRFASGSTWGAYNRFAQLYKTELAKEGLTIEVMETKGSTDNLKLLTSGKADIAFIQGGIVPENNEVEFVSLGSVYFEPLWIFVRGDETPTLLDDLAGLKVAIGSEGSGTRAVALELFKDARLMDDIEFVAAGGEAAEQMLTNKEVDAVFSMGAPDIPAISRLLLRKDVQLLQFERSRALERRHQFFARVTLYSGVVDLKNNVPPSDIELLAPAATLVVRKGFHQALPPVILSAAKVIHGEGTILSEHGDFPSPQYCSFPIAKEAKTFYQRGLSFLYRHLPFYLASGLDRMAILLLPFVGLLIPIVRLLPPVYNWTMKRKIYKRYRALQRLESKVGLMPYEELVVELEEMEEAARKLASMPPAYGADIYALRSNLERVRDRILASQTGPRTLSLKKVEKSPKLHQKHIPEKDDGSESEGTEEQVP